MLPVVIHVYTYNCRHPILTIDVIEHVLTSLEEFQESDRRWALSQILNLVVNKYNLLRAGCYFEISREIILKKALISVRRRIHASHGRW